MASYLHAEPLSRRTCCCHFHLTLTQGILTEVSSSNENWCEFHVRACRVVPRSREAGGREGRQTAEMDGLTLRCYQALHLLPISRDVDGDAVTHRNQLHQQQQPERGRRQFIKVWINRRQHRRHDKCPVARPSIASTSASSDGLAALTSPTDIPLHCPRRQHNRWLSADDTWSLVLSLRHQQQFARLHDTTLSVCSIL